MRRSEIISKLHEYIKGVTFEGDLGTCEDILLIIESVGMLPPKREKLLGVQYMIDGTIANRSVWVNEWEEE